MGATQPVLGATAGLQGSVLSGLDSDVRGGRQAGNRRGHTYAPVFLLSSGSQAAGVWG